MLFYNGKQILEGIDGIDLLIQPYLYPYLEIYKIDSSNKVSVYTKTAKVPQYIENIYANKYYHYLHISGEFINPDIPIIESIINALFILFNNSSLKIKNEKTSIFFDVYSKNFIKNNLRELIRGISGIEFCFDFPEQCIKVNENTKIINVNDKLLPQYLKNKLKDRIPCLIKEGNTYYSYDFNKNRKSTLKLYNRAEHLTRKNNELTRKVIENNPYKLRIEFVFKRNYNTGYLTINNLEGNYHDIIKRFIPYLAKLYRKYFLNRVSVICPITHLYFNEIYSLAHTDYIRNLKILESDKIDKDINNKTSDYQKYIKLRNYLIEEEREIKKTIKDIPNKYFAATIQDISSQNTISPFDYLDEENILIKDKDGDNEYIFLSDKYFNPELKKIDNEKK